MHNVAIQVLRVNEFNEIGQSLLFGFNGLSHIRWWVLGTQGSMPGGTLFGPVNGIAGKEPFARGLETLLVQQRCCRMLKRCRMPLCTQVNLKIDGRQNAQAVGGEGTGVDGC